MNARANPLFGFVLGASLLLAPNNRIHGNFFGVLIDAGFPSRAATHEWSADFNLRFEANDVFGNLHAPIVSFTRFHDRT